MAKRLPQTGRVKMILRERKYLVALFIGIFVVVGVGFLLATKALTSSVAVESEDGQLSGNVKVVDDVKASNNKAAQFNNPPLPPPPPSPQLKPQARGAVDRDGYDSNVAIAKQNIKIPAAYQGIVNNFVLMLDWSKIQPGNSNELNTTFIDDAIREAKAKNMHIKLRILAGIHSPTWVKNLEGGPFDVYDIDGTTGQQFSGTAPKYWTASVKSAYSNLMTKLAAKYDTDPTVLSVTNSLCTTIFAEPFIKNLDEGNNMTSFYAAGMTTELDKQCQNESVDIHNAAWKYTRTETAINPLSYKGTDASGNNIEKFDVDFSIAWVGRCRQVMGARCIMGNNGFNATAGPAGSNYRRVIGAIICQGNPPPYFQTRQQAVITSTGNTLAGVLSYAVRVGAGMVELPVQYRSGAISTTELAPLDTALETNNAIPCPADRLLPNP